MNAQSVTSPPNIDGKLSESAWKTADWVDGFVQRSPDNGAAPSRETAFAVLFDDEKIYIAIRCAVESKDEIVTRLVRRDREGSFDNITITLSPRGDNRTGYAFIVNPSGVKRDLYLSNDIDSDDGWDGIWQAETQIYSHQWTVEVAIPFSQLRIPRHRQQFRFQLTRWMSKLRETDVFNSIPAHVGGGVSNAGVLTGIEAVETEHPVTFIPETYLAFGETSNGVDSRQEDGFSFGGGGYAKIGILPDLVLDMAILPDFGQVEADDVVLNLSTYETQFPEKRPFFLEGAGLLNTPIQLFYSRRLGQPPTDPPMDDGEKVVRGAVITPILGAVKLTGRTSKGLSFGAIDAVYLPTQFLVKNEELKSTTLKDGTPWTNIFVLRTLSEIGTASSIGVLGTALNPSGTDGAYSGGVDVHTATSNRIYIFNGQLAGMVRFADVNQKDPTNGASLYLNAGKTGGQHFHYQAAYRLVSKGFDPNDLGYEQRDNVHKYAASFDLADLDGFGPFKQAYMGAGVNGSWNLDGVRLYNGIWMWQSGFWPNNWEVVTGMYGAPPYFDDRETRGDHSLYLPGNVGANLTIKSPPEGTIGFIAGIDGAHNIWGYTLYGYTTFSLRMDRFDLELSPSVKRTFGGIGFVETVENGDTKQAVLGRRDITQVNITLKGTVMFTRDLTFQLQSQLMNVGLKYYDYSTVLQNGRTQPFDYVDDDGQQKESDFVRTNLILQGVLRFEYLPGSTLFLIYAHKGVVRLDENSRVFDALSEINQEDREQLVMFKLSHRFGL